MIAKEQRVKEARRTGKRAVVGILAFMASAFGYGFDAPALVELRLGDGDWKPSAEHPRGRRHDGGPRRAGRTRRVHVRGRMLLHRTGKPAVRYQPTVCA